MKPGRRFRPSSTKPPPKRPAPARTRASPARKRAPNPRARIRRARTKAPLLTPKWWTIRSDFSRSGCGGILIQRIIINQNKKEQTMALNVKPLGDRVLVEPVEEKEVKKGGIIIPDTD